MVKNKIILSIAVLVFGMLACAQPSVMPTATSISPADIAGTAIQQFAAAEATQFSVNIRFTATEQVLEATRAAQVVIDNAAATQQARRDAQATADQMRADIAATQQRKDIEATARQADIYMMNTQSALATSTWEAMTMTAINPHATLTQQAVDNQIIVNNNNAQASSLDLEKKRDTNRISWQIPLWISLGILAMFGLYIWQTSHQKTILDGNGEFQGYVYHDNLVIPDKSLGPVIRMKRNPDIPLLVDDVETQKEITKDFMRVKGLKALSEVSPMGGFQSYQGYFNQSPQGEFDVINAETTPANLGDEDISALDNEWNAKVNNDG